MKLAPVSTRTHHEKYILRGDVQGTEIIHNSIAYTLNFEQQTKLLDYLNQSLPVGSDSKKNSSPFLFTKFIIYRFQAPPLEFIPIAVLGNDLLFSAPTWNPNGYMRETSSGEMLNLLNSTFDP